MKFLGLDVGKKNIGVAILDTEIGIVFPRDTIKAKSLQQAINEIKKIIERENINKIIIGLPLNFNSSESEIQKYIQNFCRELKKNTQIDIELFDERFTTKIASLYTKSGKNIDSISAKIILEDYLRLKNLIR